MNNKTRQKIIDLYVIKFLYNKYKLKSISNRNKYEHIKTKKKAILMLVPTHTNLGDHAIAHASKKIINKMYPDREYIEIGVTQFYKEYFSIKSMINDDDIVFIIGGGNMNNYYWYEEWTRRKIIKLFNKNKIISLPQTAGFTNNLLGKISMLYSAKIYSKNKNLILFARENYTYELFKKYFKNNKSFLAPDIVLSLNQADHYSKRTKIGMSLRDDRESILSEDFKNELNRMINLKFTNIIDVSTHTKNGFDLNIREDILVKKWDQYKKCKCVITDRLHSMIFCAITNTPCIVFKSFDNKILGTYELWLSSYRNIKFIKVPNLDNIESLLKDIVNENNINHESINSSLIEIFDNFEKLIKY